MAECNQVGLVIFRLEPDGIVYANSAAAEALGTTVEGLVSQPIAALVEMVVPEQRQEVADRLAARARGDTASGRFLLTVARPDGQMRRLDVVTTRIDEIQGTLVQASFLDVTDSRRRDQALRASETRYRNLFESMNDAGFLADAETGLLVDANRQAERLLGKPRDQIIGMHHLGLHPEEDLERYRKIFQNHVADRLGIAEAEVAHADGTRRPVLISTASIELDGRPHLLGLFHDTSKLKQAEREREQVMEKMLQAQKLESLGVLAGGVAHDFNNLLLGVLGNTELASLELPPASAAHAHLDNVRQAAMQAAELARQLLAYAGRGPSVMATRDLNEVFRGIRPLLETTVAGRAVLSLELAGQRLSVECDESQLRQVLLNLVGNAAEACEGRSGQIQVTTGRQTCDRACLASMYVHDDLPEGEYTFVEVADQGCGIDEPVLARIFEPFFSTKFTGRGLGLAAVLGIVRSHRGAIQVDSRLGEGTRIRVLLPISASSATERVAAGSQPAWAGQGLVLVVDDEALALQVAVRMLERIGFSVLTANDGASALDIFRRQAAEIRLVLLDLTMPGLGGAEVLAELSRISPDVRVLLTSGYDEGEVLDRVAGLDAARFLRKPYRLTDLTAKIRAMLEPVDPA